MGVLIRQSMLKVKLESLGVQVAHPIMVGALAQLQVADTSMDVASATATAEAVASLCTALIPCCIPEHCTLYLGCYILPMQQIEVYFKW